MAEGKPVNRSSRTASTKDHEDTKWSAYHLEHLFSRFKVFTIFSAAHLLAALLSPIQDCDEVFNYWEATHYLNHGYGFETWEYSPVYAIRSWAYAALHSIVIAPFTLISPYLGGKTTEFYALRLALAILCAVCETRLAHAIAGAVSPRIAKLFMLIMISSTGMFHASAAYLPSSFAMYTTMLGVADFLKWHEPGSLSRGILWFALGSTLGWPFVGVIVLPFVLVAAGFALSDGRVSALYGNIVSGGFQSLTIAISQAGIDSMFYGKWLCVPLNIVLYNVFAGDSRGPDIYGTEPWHFYIRNLLLNFNIFFLFALVAHPLLLLQKGVHVQPSNTQSFVRDFNLTAAFYLWLTIFSLQPHKEERFMYPAYPLLAINAAYSIHIVLQRLSYISPRLSLVMARPPNFKIMTLTHVFLAGMALSLLRTSGLVTGYSAPLKVYHPLQHLAVRGDTVCLGKEWYRFPSSYFLPDGVKGKFVKSSFLGLLPGEYAENAGKGWTLAGTRAVPAGMNDRNEEDMSKYVELSNCTFLVDSQVPSSAPTTFEPNYADDEKTWEAVTCERFLDVSATSTLGRILWTPDTNILPRFLKRRWGRYCLLKRKNT